MDKWERREAKLNKQRWGMVVDGRSVKTVLAVQPPKPRIKKRKPRKRVK